MTDAIVTVHTDCPLDFDHCIEARCRHWKDGLCTYFAAKGITGGHAYHGDNKGGRDGKAEK